MKTFFRISMVIALLVTVVTVSAADHGGHHAQVKHNMILYGENEIFVSHLVYKAPHNYQVILKVQFPENIRERYFETKKAHPDDTYIFLLDKMHIAEIGGLESITGTLTRTDSGNVKTVLAESVKVDKADYKVVFFNELPLNLE